MDKLLAFGRKAMFYARVLSGYEERRIRRYRLQLQQRIQNAEQRKAELRKIPEQVILSEVRRVVTEMQNLNKKLDDTEAAIEDYFKPIDMEADVLMKVQLEGEEKTMKEMMKTMQAQALLEKAEAEKAEALKMSNTDNLELEKPSEIDLEADVLMKVQLEGEEKTMKEMMKTMQAQALLEKAEAEKAGALKMSNTDNLELEKPSEDSSSRAGNA